ncbi:MAG TPA: PTS sugar transporter subunit IIA [Deltaproteobacteria bacterium]|nr:PTS sugar transporter subunit IIA [Deltaproteobacteria bacterium]HPR53514.1 PTS sugar transporter subunit IIA [Deltaproteobacteria bacterium]HXK46149.1 PTS sugar transporter subunit IIA [Deltaproteobacteria bacterium]
MVGIIVVAHGDLARAFEETAQMIVGPTEAFKACSFVQGTDVDDLRRLLKASIKEVNRGEGVIILTDMFGGTPSNISLSFLENGKIEVITGVNLPMVITALTKRKGKEISELARLLKEGGSKNIHIASEILATNVAEK